MKQVMAAVLVATVGVGHARAENAIQWRVQDGGNGHWYGWGQVAISDATFQQVREAAVARGGHLPTISNAAENAWVHTNIGGGLGLFHLPGGAWQNVTGEPVTYFNWAPGQPSSLDQPVNAAYWSGTSDTWADFTDAEIGNPADPNTGFRVEWDADCNNDGIVDYGQILDGSLTDANVNNIPDCCEAGTPCAIAAKQWRVEDGGNGHWYALKRVQPSVNPEVFFGIANQLGGHAATVSSEGENAFCGQFVVPYEGTLFGLRKLSGTNQISWVTGEPVTYVNWNVGEGTNIGERYALLMVATNARWQDTDLTPRQWLLVEWDADCNSDGIVDFGQIRDGTLADANHDNIPDCCEAGQSCTPCPGDIVEDHTVNGVDLAAVINAWGTNGGKIPRADTNHDGIVDGVDLANVLGSWGPCP